jgi:CHAT domain-containing protein
MNIKHIVVILITVITSSCMILPPSSPPAVENMQKFMVTGKHKLVIDEFSRTGGFEKWTPHEAGWEAVGYVCSSYYELMMIQQFNTCIEENRKTVPPKYLVDFYTSKYNDDMKDYQEALYLNSKALYYLAIGDFYNAYINSKESIEVGKNSKAFSTSIQGPITTYGISAASLGKFNEANAAVERLFTEETLLDSSSEWVHKMRQDAASRILSAAKNYKGVLEIYNRKNENNPSAGSVLLKVMNTVSSLGTNLIVEGAVDLYLDANGWNDTVNLSRTFIVTKALYETGNIEKAKISYDEALKSPIVKNFGRTYPFILRDRANIALLENDKAYAEELLKEAIELIEEQRSFASTERDKMGFLGDKNDIYKDLISILQEERPEEAYNYVERAKSRALVDVLATKKKFKSNSSKSNQLISELNDVELESLQSANSSNNKVRSINIQSNLSKVDSNLSSLITVKALSLKNIQDKLKKNETLVEYYGSGDEYFIFVITRSSIESVKIESSKLELLVSEYRNSLSSHEVKNYKKSSKALYQLVFTPIQNMVKGKHVTIVPHGSLHYAPFGALWDGKKYLVQKYQIRILPSASVIEFLKKKVANKAGNLLILGNPDLGDPEFDLPAAQEESLRLAKAVKGSKVLLRKQATETALKKYGSSFKNIHFAMHGLFEAEKPLSSGLFLAPDNENDGRLTVSELYDLDLNADLVTLSACETALGETKSGDDVIGFTRGFLYAGANSIVSSLWEVDDEATRDLMLRFYKELKSNNKARALQKAQLRVMKKYPHPYYWAAFQLTGQY